MTSPTKFLIVCLLGLPSFLGAAAAPTPEEIWKSLEKLPAAEREKKLVEGAKKEGEMLWYTNSGIENATRYIQAFKKNYPYVNAQVWRAKTRQVTQRALQEAAAGKNFVDVIKPSTDLLPPMLEKNLLGKYERLDARSFRPMLNHLTTPASTTHFVSSLSTHGRSTAKTCRKVGTNYCNPGGRARFSSMSPR